MIVQPFGTEQGPLAQVREGMDVVDAAYSPPPPAPQPRPHARRCLFGRVLGSWAS